MIQGDWTYRLLPKPGELLSSCLTRNAHAHACASYRFLNFFWEHDPVWSRDFDRDPSTLIRRTRSPNIQDWLSDVANRLFVNKSRIEASTLAGWRQKLCSGSPSRFGDTPLILSAGVYHRTRTRHALQYCPACLAEGLPHFRKAWRLGFVVGCDRHNCLLRDSCPHCDAAVVPHRSQTLRLIDCHLCLKPITALKIDITNDAQNAPESVMALQRKCLSALENENEKGKNVAAPKDSLIELRTLLAVSAVPHVRSRLDSLFGLAPARPTGKRMRFEHLRLQDRIAWLAAIAAWTGDGSASFHAGAKMAGLTRRSFVRTPQSIGLAENIKRLPSGLTRSRTWKPILEEPTLRRLRRKDPAAYRSMRARRILDACYHP